MDGPTVKELVAGFPKRFLKIHCARDCSKRTLDFHLNFSVAIVDINRSQIYLLQLGVCFRYEGKIIAMVGTIINIVGLLTLPVVGIVAAITIPSFLSARRAAAGNMQRFTRAELDYFNRYRKYATPEELRAAKEIDRNRMSD
jgi:hypothetical protein